MLHDRPVPLDEQPLLQVSILVLSQNNNRNHVSRLMIDRCMRCSIDRCRSVDDEGRMSVDGWVRESVDVKAAASSDVERWSLRIVRSK
ncbi:hypothetical protein DY000_02015962 [Brassica cretica]|uniref:Uncharacterized protein n=1 Tax=Brassica cretica TaxID=69181 RepID=A0ABQ7D555_BRACR|nr:hypothetical protein DY000_02015962 [Brassica cretica]